MRILLTGRHGILRSARGPIGPDPAGLAARGREEAQPTVLVA